MTLRPVQASFVLVGLLALGVSFSAGRYTAPAKVEVRQATATAASVVYRDRLVEHEVAGPVRTVTRTVERLVPCAAGDPTPQRETTTVVEAGSVVIDRVGDQAGQGTLSTTSTTQTITSYDQPRLMLQAGASLGASLAPQWRLGALYRLAGPLWVGASYLSTQRGELTLAFTF